MSPPPKPTSKVVECENENGICHLDAVFESLEKRVGELEMNVGSLTGEVSESLKAIGSAPDKAKRLEGSGIARSVVEIQESIGEIKFKLDQDEKEKTVTNIQKISQTELFLKKVQTVGGIVTSISGIIGIVGGLVAGFVWILKHIPH